jgi:hypothetical protein
MALGIDRAREAAMRIVWIARPFDGVDRRGPTWFARGWHTVHGGLRALFWAWLAAALVLGIRLLDVSGVESVGGDVVDVPIRWAGTYARPLVAYSMLAIAFVTGVAAMRVVAIPRQAGGKLVPVGASLALVAAAVLELVAFPEARAFVERLGGELPTPAAASTAAGLATIVGCALLLATLHAVAVSLETRTRNVLASVIAALLAARAAVLVLPLVTPVQAAPALGIGLALAVYVAFLPILDGLARTTSLVPFAPEPTDAPEPAPWVEEGRAEWANASTGLAFFASSLRARLVALVVGSGLAMLALAVGLEWLRPVVSIALPVAACALGTVMALGIDRFRAALPAPTRARVAAWVAFLLVALGAVADGALALASTDLDAASATTRAALPLAAVATVAPVLGLLALLFAFHRVAVALGSSRATEQVRSAAHWFLGAMPLALALRLGVTTIGVAAPIALACSFGALVLVTAAMGRYVGATRSLRASCDDLAEEAVSGVAAE